MIAYTICFVRSGDRLLLVNRQFAPNQGLWNGVGGKIEPGERPLAAVIREVGEETGIPLKTARFAGLVTWGDRYDEIRGGMYAYMAEVAEPLPAGPLETPEGILAWKELGWVLDPENEGVVSNIPRFLPVMLQDPVPYEHRCLYRHGLLRAVIRHQLPAEGDLATGTNRQR
ncbi:MAG: NUDIX hydrolase [Bacillota bacterium]